MNTLFQYIQTSFNLTESKIKGFDSKKVIIMSIDVPDLKALVRSQSLEYNLWRILFLQGLINTGDAKKMYTHGDVI